MEKSECILVRLLNSLSCANISLPVSALVYITPPLWPAGQGHRNESSILRNLAFSMSDGVRILGWGTWQCKLEHQNTKLWPTCLGLKLVTAKTFPPPSKYFTKVQATKCKDMAFSTLQDKGIYLSQSTKNALTKVASAHQNNAERDLHRLFRREGLSLPVEMSTKEFGFQKVHFLSLLTWWKFLLKSHPKFVLGGFDREEIRSNRMLQTFWKHYKSNHDDHAVFDLHETQGRLGKCVPYYLHIDEGTGLRRSAVLVISMQTVFGRETSKIFAGNFSNFMAHSQHELEARMTRAQYHNAKGSTYLTRFLWTVLPKKSYSQKNSHVYWGLLDLLATECKKLMEEGISVGGEVWFPVCLGLKGDQPALIKSGAFRRSFMNLGAGRGICWECCAGLPGFEFEQCGESPTWAATVGLAPPWVAGQESPLLRIPCQPSLPHGFWKRDPFHAFKQTLGGHFGASTIILFAIDSGLWKIQGQSSDVDSMLERAFGDFRYFVCHEWRGNVVNHTKAFTRQTLHFPDYKKFPYARWKGSDQMLIIRWLRHVLLHGIVLPESITRDGQSLLCFPPKDWQAPFFKGVLDGCNSSIIFFHTLHREGVWWSRELASEMSAECRKFCISFGDLARLSHERGIARYHLEPCLHTFRHFGHDIDVALAAGCDEVLSPSTQTCEMDEDFVGKICKGSRHVHPMATNQRTIERYLLRCHAEFAVA